MGVVDALMLALEVALVSLLVWLMWISRAETLERWLEAGALVEDQLDDNGKLSYEPDSVSWGDHEDTFWYRHRVQTILYGAYKYSRLGIVILACALVIALWLVYKRSWAYALLLPLFTFLITLLVLRSTWPLGEWGGDGFEIEYSGRALVPSRVPEGNSCIVYLDLNRCFEASPYSREGVRVYDVADGKLVLVRIEGPGNYLEVELVGAGFDVNSPRSQRRPAGDAKLSYQWACYFPNSGDHTIALIVRLVSAETTANLGKAVQVIRVTSFCNLTGRQMSAIKWCLALAITVMPFLMRLR